MPEQKKVVFFGTPKLAAEILLTLSSGSAYEVCAIVSNPDAPVGREQIITESPVKHTAKRLSIPVFTPEYLDEKFYERIAEFEPDVFLVVAYGKIFPKNFIDLPKLGTFNLHFSLLPKYRGASPVQTAILSGDETSGITIFHLEEELDSGDIYAQEITDIQGKNAAEVFTEMTVQGGKMLKNFCEMLCSGQQFHPMEQIEDHVTLCSKFQKSNGEIFPETESANSILRKFRAFYVWPGIFWIDPKTGKRIKFLELKASDLDEDWNETFFEKNGKCYLSPKRGTVEILSAQPEGKNPMSGMEFWNYIKTLS